MNAVVKCWLSVVFLLIFSLPSNAQANLTIVNNSARIMTVKVMQVDEADGTLHKTVTIGANGSEIVYFTKTGFYYTKTKAVLEGTDPICRQREPFEVTNEPTGYSVMTLTFTITESLVPLATGGKSISLEEFEKN